MSEHPDLILIRHAEVAAKWKTICYGAMDVRLSSAGEHASQAFATRLAGEVQPTAIYHSDLHRTRMLAELLADAYSVQVPVIADARLREREYGRWQGQTWDKAYASDPENFIGLIEAPDTYRPPGGETTTEMQNRIVQWFADCIPPTKSKRRGPVVAISHSGPIAALAGQILGLHARDWHPWTIGTLESISIRSKVVVRSANV